MSDYNAILEDAKVVAVVTTEDNTNIGTDYSDLYTDAELTTGLEYLYVNILEHQDYTETGRLDAYGNITEYISKQRITIDVLGTFLRAFAYPTVYKFKREIDKYPIETLGHLDIFFAPKYKTNADGGLSICAIDLNPLIGTAQTVVSAVNLLSGDAIAIKSMFSGLESIVDRAVDQARGQFQALLSNQDDLVEISQQQVARAVGGSMARDAAAIAMMLDPENIQRLKDDLETRMAEAASAIKNGDLSKIHYLQSLLCSLTSHVTGTLLNPIDSYADKINRHQLEKKALKARSSIVTSSAVAAGRPSVDPSKAADAVAAYNNKSQTYWDPTVDPYAEPGRYTLVAPTSHPDPSSWSNLSFGPGVLNMDRTAKRKAALLLDAQALGLKSLPSNIGYYGARVEEIFLVNRAAKMVGISLTIVSAYRPPNYNRVIGGAKASQHMRGVALDCLWPAGTTTQQKQAFVAACYQLGFDAFGYYDTFVHVDSRGSPASWGKPHVVWTQGKPSWHP